MYDIHWVSKQKNKDSKKVKKNIKKQDVHDNAFMLVLVSWVHVQLPHCATSYIRAKFNESTAKTLQVILNDKISTASYLI